MAHTIEFPQDVILDVEISLKHRLEQILLRRGDRLTVQLRPYVIETDRGPVEVADVFFADGTVSRAVPYTCFSFVDRS